MLTQNIAVDSNLIYGSPLTTSGNISTDEGSISYRILLNSKVYQDWNSPTQQSVNVWGSIPYDEFIFGVNNLVFEFTDGTSSDSRLFLVERVVTELNQPTFVYPNYVELTWKPFLFNNRSAYMNTKIIRSESMDFASSTEFIINDVDALSFIDNTVINGTYYYKLLINLSINAYTGDKIDFDKIEESLYIRSSSKITFNGGVAQLSFASVGDSVGYTLGNTPVTNPYSENRISGSLIGGTPLSTDIFPILTSATTPAPYIASHSSNANFGNYSIHLLFGENNVFLFSENINDFPSWYKIFVGSSISVWKWSFDAPGNFDIYLQGSFNNADWTNIDHRIENPGYFNPRTKWTYTLTNPSAPFSYFRLYFVSATSSTSDGRAEIGNVHMYKYDTNVTSPIVVDLNPININGEKIIGLNIVSANDAPLTLNGNYLESSTLGQGVVYSTKLTRELTSVSLVDNNDNPLISEVTKLGSLRYAFSVDGIDYYVFRISYEEGENMVYLESNIYPVLTSDSSPSPYYVSASSRYGGDLLYAAFNGAYSLYRTSGASMPQWMMIDVGTVGKRVWKWGFYINGNFNVYFQGSNDGTNWADIDYREQYPGATTDNFFEFTAPVVSASYRYFRIYFTYYQGTYSTTIHISNIYMREFTNEILMVTELVPISDIAYEGMTEEQCNLLTSTDWEKLYTAGSIYTKVSMFSNSSVKPCFIDSIYFLTIPSNHYYLTTGDLIQLDTSDWIRVNSIQIIQEEPSGSAIRYAFSFDERQTWKIYNGSWILVDLNFLHVDGMTADEVITMDMDKWADVLGGTIDVSISLQSESANASPMVDQFTFDYTTVPNQLISEGIQIPVPKVGFKNRFDGSIYVTEINRYMFEDGKWSFNLPTSFSIAPYSSFKGKFEVGKVVYTYGFKDTLTSFSLRDTTRSHLRAIFYAVTDHGFLDLHSIFSARETTGFNMLTKFYLKPPLSIFDLGTAFILVHASKCALSFDLRAVMNLPTTFKVTNGSNLRTQFKTVSKATKYGFIM